MDHDPSSFRAADARRRALRTARVVTLSFAAAALGGCGSATLLAATPDVAADADPGTTVDVPVPPRDAATGADVLGDARADARGDAGPNCNDLRGATDGGVNPWLECCRQNGWDWRRGCEAWGPFMPPEMAG